MTTESSELQRFCWGRRGMLRDPDGHYVTHAEHIADRASRQVEVRTTDRNYAEGSPHNICRAIERDLREELSRQVANKAEVEQVQTADVDKFVKSSIRDFADFREDVERLSTADRKTARHIRKSIYDTIDARVRNSVIAVLASRATSPETTGASTEQVVDRVRADVGPADFGVAPENEKAARNFANFLLSQVGASTVLTDEQIWEIACETIPTIRIRPIVDFARAIEREVAAQAGQVAVPEGWREFIENIATPYSEPLNSVSGYRDLASRKDMMGVLRSKAQELLAAAPSPAKGLK